MHEVGLPVVDRIELEGEVELVLEEVLEFADGVIAGLARGRRGHAARLDHLVEDGIVGLEALGDVAVVGLLGDVNGRHETEGDTIGVAVGGFGGFEAVGAIIHEADEFGGGFLGGGRGGGRGGLRGGAGRRRRGMRGGRVGEASV